MARILEQFHAFYTDESGATAIEYGLIAALVSVAAITAFQALGQSLVTMFNTVTNAILPVLN